MKTNPEYAALAYRKAILTETVTMLRRHYVSDDMGHPPQRTLQSGEVLRDDSEVPQEHFYQFITELETKAAEVDLEMRSFEFKRKNVTTAEPPRPQSSQVPAKKGAKGAKGTRRSRPPEPPNRAEVVR